MIVDEIVSTASRMTDAPRLYIEAAAWWVVSSTIGRRIVIPYLPRPPENPARPNLWVVISGLPGVMRKSTVIEGVARYLVRQAWTDYISSTYPEYTQKQVNERVSKMFIETGSYEGITKHISEAQEVIDTFFIVSSEWGGVMQTMKNRDYMIGLATLLSKLYSGEEHLPRLVKETRYIRPGLYVTAILGMQEPWLYLDNIVFRQGLMRRMVFVYQTPEDKESWMPPLDLSRGMVSEELSAIAGRLARMMEVWGEEDVEARMEREAVEAINEYARRLEEEIYRNPSSNWALYSQNLWEHAAKIAVLRAAARMGRPEQGATGPYIVVTVEDAREAVSFIEKTTQRAREALAAAGAQPGRAQVRVSDEAEDLVLSALRPRGCATASELLRATRIMKDDLKKIVVNLMEKDGLRAFHLKKSRGRPTLWFCLPRPGDSFQSSRPGAVELTPRAVEEMW